MKLETLGKSNKKKILIGGLIGLSLVSVVTLTTTRAKYRNTQSVKLATGTVSYKSPDLQLVAIQVSEAGENYTNSDTLPEGNYKLNTEKSICKVNDVEDKTIPIEYKDGRVYIGVNQKNTKCYLYLDKKQEPTSKDTLSNLNITNYKTTAPTFTSVATSDEGIFQTDDPMYKTEANPNPKTYYWRGAATTNHVIFASKCWRIVRINGDGTIRLIYNGAVQSWNKCNASVGNKDAVIYSSTTSDRYYATSGGAYNNASYVGWTYTLNTPRTLSGTDSNAKTQTEKWFNNNSNFTAAQREQVAEGKFCNDREVVSGSSFSGTGTAFQYAANKRIYTDYKPSLSCNSGDIYKVKVAAITADEVMLAGGNNNNNLSYYLYAAENYWTMSPSYWSGNAYMLRMLTNGYFDSNNVDSTSGIRPVINLKADTNFSYDINKNAGTIDNPYIVN